MKKSSSKLALLTLCLAASCGASPVPVSEETESASPPRHLVVYREAGRFGGWPANHGIWSWGDEILVGFESGVFRSQDKFHAIDYAQPAEHLLARSLDGGESWSIERPEGLIPPPGQRVAGVPTPEGGRDPVDCPGGIDFSRPGFAMTLRMLSFHIGPSRFAYSYDRGKTWEGPFALPDFGTPGVAARTDYLINGSQEALVFLTAAKPNGKEGRVLCARTQDGGKTWEFVSWITPQPEGFSIMPSSVRLSDARIVTAVRRQEEERNFIEGYHSDDGGETWQFLSTISAPTGNSGNPPSLVLLRDGRLCVTYGWREEPYGVRARLSSDGGETWGREIVLRADGGGKDLGYPRTVQRADGKLVTVYYFNDSDDSERYIAATIWNPGPASSVPE